ncbi:sugar kinase, ribokinase family [Mycoavidus cysteinexigens]|uniref:Sugar kinase, ribokinase family n=1 Tax=Mycoavidus cysteinexigens TaxID=1553431 RepID=A0A2Z6EY63_9BURK|nr:carbohydrate kinase family protein [Mycoavidus cysteinexigens]BBE10065.1 sugar kinase, ribokinase family [Mycoavidus cysteinexigens]GLR00481.1 sugar kinase [Mycoavidus cysteinexigens]
MSTLICGSLAYDTLMTFEGRFCEHILPQQAHILNLSFLVPTMRREFGGCAGNIAYSLSALGGTPYIMATLGAIDAQDYLDHLAQLKLPTDYLRVLPSMYSAQAMVTTDLENNQITTFHAGAMLHAHVNQISQTQGITLGIVAPDGGDAMRQHTEQFAAADIPFVFDPGQGLPLFQGAELQKMIELSAYLILNDYEAQLLSDKTGWSIAQIAARVKAMIVTRGEQGALIYHEGNVITLPAVPVEQVIDPTGCGDAFRGGVLYGIEHGLDWATTGRLANLMGSIKAAHQGPQSYSHRWETIHEYFKQTFSYSLQ